ncbi:glycosyltransferase family 2 protein [Methylophaga thalassica]|uniref:glycosyltransferase family 2 protein n=1 Tax=Methylophaga thalassica TaxID=40223 RepID=UPI002E7B9247|nr:glycosyltransferase family 2 protein [Methylophaga thalassica]WVI86113.1 glycosyltransferase family 2 protein [Methylophaga thalassica]
MKISIITVCFNSVKTINDTIQSVALQDYPNIEHIIVDGGSTDGTYDIIANAPTVTKFISEPDDGIYDAMNKGISIATGDIIGTLNADDFYATSSVLRQVANTFRNSEIDACFADLVYVDVKDTDKVIRYWKSKPFVSGLFRCGWMPAHPTFFVRSLIYEQFGMFDLRYKLAADMQLLFRFLEKYKIRTVYLPEIFIKMRIGGATNKNIKNIYIQNKEILSVLNEFYGKSGHLRFFTCKIIERLKQFVLRPKNTNY